MIQQHKLREREHADHSSKRRALEEEMKQLRARVERAAMERDDAVTKFEESARASGALLRQVNDVEQGNENLQREVADLKEVGSLLRLQNFHVAR